tara:strand:+ start:82 stop:459 length:378 start_codon:yes stop_codon:yes gene_type:complete
MLFDNHIIISNYDDLKIDFKNYLSKKDSIIFKRCSNLDIKINSKINKLMFLGCSNVTLKCSETISGIDIEKCKYFNLKPLEPYLLNNIDCFKSYIELHLEPNIKLNGKLQIINQKSIIKIITDQP